MVGGSPTHHIGPALIEFGPFQVRAEWTVLHDGLHDGLEVGKGRWVWFTDDATSTENGADVLTRLMPILHTDRDLAYLLSVVLAWLRERRHLIVRQQQLYDELVMQLQDPLTYRELQVSLEEDVRRRGGAQDGADVSLHPTPARTVEDYLHRRRGAIEKDQARFDRVMQAVSTLATAHPDIELGTIEEAVNPDVAETFAQHRAAVQHARTWWHHEPSSPATFLEEKEEVARFGRFRVYQVTRTYPDGRRTQLNFYPIGVATEASGIIEFDLPSAGTIGKLCTAMTNRQSTITGIRNWLREFRFDIASGEQALAEVSDAEIAARIRQGVAERKRQYRAVEDALREVEAEGTPPSAAAPVQPS